ncbi:MAG: HAMP domain-containing histidine kinase [Acidimicrobiia bacterium]|nr:HAMP domain-containing histidine kinase [Acidimicrobiia bacterium]
MRRGFRTRVTVLVIGLVTATVVIVSLAAFGIVSSALRAQLVENGVAQAEFNITVLVPAAGSGSDTNRTAFEETELTQRFLSRGSSGFLIDFGDGDPYASRPDLLALEPSEPVETLIEAGRYGFEFAEVAGTPSLVVGARRPGSETSYYFVSDASVLVDSRSTLIRFLALGAAVVIGIGALAATSIARRVLRPVSVASEAAQRLAGGDLATRVPVESTDEFGSLSEAFNTMASSLQDHVGALERAEARERRFVADVSHELRTPLTALSNEAHLLTGMSDQLPDAGRRAAELLAEDVRRFRRLVEELLEINRLDADAAPASRSQVDIARLVEALAAERLPGVVSIGPLPGLVEIDRVSLERIIGNIFDNAAAHAPGARVDVSGAIAGDSLRLVIGDHGPGVDPELLDQIFDRFFKADPSRRGGSGLGLAIARRHARRMGGELVAENADGLRFVLDVPVTEPLRGEDGRETGAAHDESVERTT